MGAVEYCSPPRRRVFFSASPQSRFDSYIERRECVCAVGDFKRSARGTAIMPHAVSPPAGIYVN